ARDDEPGAGRDGHADDVGVGEEGGGGGVEGGTVGGSHGTRARLVGVGHPDEGDAGEAGEGGCARAATPPRAHEPDPEGGLRPASTVALAVHAAKLTRCSPGRTPRRARLTASPGPAPLEPAAGHPGTPARPL